MSFNILSTEKLGEQAKPIYNSISKIGYICPEGQDVIFGHTTELGLKASQQYTLSFCAWSEKNYSVCWDLWTPPNIGDEELLPQHWFYVTPKPTLYQWTFSVDVDFIPRACMRFLNVMKDGTINNIISPIYVADIKITETLLTNRTRGASYDYTDLNRVESALEYLRDRLQKEGTSVIIKLHGEWKNGDNFTVSNANDYLFSVSAIKAAMPKLETTPKIPDDMENMTSIEANNIEKILVDVETLINNMVAIYLYSGEIYCGEVNG